jgi:hypothetical protein
VELPDAVQLVIVRGQPIGMAPLGPGRTEVRADRQRPELVEGEHLVRDLAGDVLE